MSGMKPRKTIKLYMVRVRSCYDVFDVFLSFVDTFVADLLMSAAFVQIL